MSKFVNMPREPAASRFSGSVPNRGLWRDIRHPLCPLSWLLTQYNPRSGWIFLEVRPLNVTGPFTLQDEGFCGNNRSFPDIFSTMETFYAPTRRTPQMDKRFISCTRWGQMFFTSLSRDSQAVSQQSNLPFSRNKGCDGCLVNFMSNN